MRNLLISKMISIYEIFLIFHNKRILFLLAALLPPLSRTANAGFSGSSGYSDLAARLVNAQGYMPFAVFVQPPFYKSFPFILSLSVVLILLLILITAWRSKMFARERFKLEKIINERTEQLLLQKERVDELLANMLPKDTADQLKKTGRANTRKYDLVSILFSDIEGFTRIAEQMNPDILIDELDKFFFKFDSLVEEFNIEKIKTIGDAYMAAGGIPEKNRTNPVEVVLAAMRIMQYMKDLKKDNENFWDLRIGIHTGPVIAGVVGLKKLSYDIWGDSVNTASRMESSGETGKINISENTYEYVKDFFNCEYRGKMPVKYKGNIGMYFVKGFRPEFSVDMRGQEPNQNFFIRLQLLRLQDIEEECLKKMEEELPANLHFHNLKYCIDMLTGCELLFSSEKLPDEDRLLVRTSALFDCISYSKGYLDRKNYIYQITREILPKFHYSEKQAEKILRLISMPFIPPAARTIPEKILSDIRLAFLGKNNFSDSANELYLELKTFGQVSSRPEFIKYMTEFLSSFSFYTLTAKKLVEIPAGQQIEKLKLMREKSDYNVPSG